LVGNYGVNYDDCQSARIQAEGFVIRELCEHPTNDQTLDAFLNAYEIPGIWDIDTRMITIMIRDEGAMRASLVPSAKGSRADIRKAIDLARRAPDIANIDLVSEVTCANAYRIPGKGKRFVLMDFGVKQNTIKNLRYRDIDLVVVPSDTPGKRIADYEPDAILLSNGPGIPHKPRTGFALSASLQDDYPSSGYVSDIS